MGTKNSGAIKRRDSVEVPQPVLNTLAGKRFALIGFESPEGKEIVSILDGIEAFGRTIDTVRIETHPSILNPFDICICAISNVLSSNERWTPCDSVSKPVLLVGTFEEILRQTPKHQHGRRDFLVKPWHVHDLLLRSFHLLRDSGPAVSANASTVEPTVIIADDDATTTTLIAALLGNNHVKTVVTRDGKEALEATRNNRAQVMVLDVNMPKLSGFEVLKAVKGDEATRQIKVAILTAGQREIDIVRAFSLGADDYVVKPFNQLELVARIKRLLGD